MDARFDTSKDPRFKRIPGNVRKVEVDERFAHMFNDKRFVETPAVDARGRKIKPDMEKQRLKSFYQFGDGQETKMPTKRGKRGGRKAKRGNPGAGDAKNPRVEGSTTLGKDKAVEKAMSNGKVPKKKTKKRSASSKEGGVPSAQGGKTKLKVRSRAKRRREEVDEEAEEADDDDDSSSQDDEEEGEDENEIIAEDSVWRAEAEEVPQGDATRRLAIMGCDWHSISAGDLLVMLRTYLSGKGSKNAGTTALQSSSVEKVSIYPSEFGMERMKVENEKGPMTLKALEDEDNHDSKATEAKQREALRKWQVEQTKYYYAVADCDSAATAAWLYDQLDGITVTGIAQGLLDLRFVPEDLEFPHSPTQVATEAPRKYQGPVVTDNTALGHTNVKCTWDEPAPQRKRDLQKKKFSSKEIQEMYLQDYLATSSEDEDIGAAVGKTDGTSKQKAAELRKQLVGSDSEDGDGDDFFKDLDEEEPRKAKKSVEMEGDTDWVRVSVSANELEEKLAERAQEQTESKGRKVRKLEGEEQKSVWQQYLDRKKAKRKERKEEAKAQRLARKGTEGAEGQVEGAATKEELEVLFANEDEDRGFNVRGRKRTAAQRAAKEEEPFEVDVEDPRFSKVFSSVDFEIDPTIPEYRPSEGMKLVLSEKRKRKLSGAARKSPADAAGAQQEPAKKTTSARPASQQAAQKKTGGLQVACRKRLGIPTCEGRVCWCPKTGGWLIYGSFIACWVTSRGSDVQELPSHSAENQDQAPVLVKFQGLLPLERAATERYAPEIARNGEVHQAVQDGNEPNWQLVAIFFVCLAVVFLFTHRGQELANKIPPLRPLAQQAARITMAVQQRRELETRKRREADVEAGAKHSAKDSGAEPSRAVEMAKASLPSAEEEDSGKAAPAAVALNKKD